MPVIGNVDIYTGSIGHIDADSMNIGTIKPTPGTNTIDLGSDATASIGTVTASFIGADTIEVGNIIRTEIDPCCVYVTGSSDVASIRFRSIQPKNSSHVNTGDYSVINGGSLNCIDGPITTIFNGIHAGSCNVIQNSSGSVIAGGMDNDVFSSLGVIGGGRCNQITGASPFSAILGGFDNCVKGHSDAFIIGSNIISSASCTTFVNCLNIQDIDQAVPGDHLLTRHTESGLVRQGPSISQVEGDVFFTNNLLNPTVDVYTTGSGPGSAAIRTGSITPYYTSHCNMGRFSVIGGGDNHCIFDSLDPGTPFYDGIFSGKNNTILDASSAFIGGGFGNLIFAEDSGSVIGGGSGNTVQKSLESSIVGGKSNCLLNTQCSFIGGGHLNLIQNATSASTIVGGVQNVIKDDDGAGTGNQSSIVGGLGNCIQSSSRAFIGGGDHNIISQSLESSIVGGDRNRLVNGGLYSSIVGGQGNCIKDANLAPTIVSGIGNFITTKVSGAFDTIVNGECNTIDLVTAAKGKGFNSITSGQFNTVISASEFGSILNGRNNKITGDLISRRPFSGSGVPDNCFSTLSSSYNSIANGTNNHICDASIFNGGRNFIGNGSNHLISEKANFDTIVNGQSNRISSNSPNSLLFTTYLNSTINTPPVSITSSLFEVNNFNITASYSNPSGAPLPFVGINPTSTTSGAPLSAMRINLRIVESSPLSGAYDRIQITPSQVGDLSQISIFVTPGTILAPGDTFTFSSESLSSDLPNGTDLILTLKEGGFSFPTSSFDDYPVMFTNVTGSVGTYRVLASPQNAPTSPPFSASITLDAQNSISEFIPLSMGSLSSYSNTVIGATFTIPSESIGYGAGVQGTDALLTIQNSSVFEQYVTNNGNSDVKSNLIGNGAGNIVRGRTSYNTILNGLNNNICMLVPSVSIDFNSILGGSGNKINFIFGRDICNNTIIGGESNKIGAHDPIAPAYCSAADTLQGNLIGGGTNNEILDSERSTILNGDENKICQDSFNSAILGGYQNSIAARAENGVIINGKCQRARSGARYSIAAGFCNLIAGGANEGFIGGGRNNTVCNASYRAGILGGCQNVIDMGKHSTIAGGDGNRIYGRNSGNGTGPLCNPRQQCNSFIGGGKDNRIGRIEQTVGHSNAIVMGLANDIEKEGVCHNLIGTGQLNQIKKFVEESSIVAGGSNIIGGTTSKSSCRSSVLGGFNNTVSSSVDSSIMGGRDNCILGLDRTFIVGSNLTADRACTTFVNSLDISSSLDFTLSEIPTSDVGLRQGQLYRTGSNFDELRIKL